MPPIRKPFTRPSARRDASLIVIAAEGQKTEPSYFEGLKDSLHNSKVHVNIIERDDASLSAPKHVLKQLKDFKTEYKLNNNDTLWMVIDLDRWSVSLPNIATQCVQGRLNLIVSNPAFELWLLLHLKGLNEYSQDEINRFTGETLKSELRNILGSYNPSNLDINQFIHLTEIAIERARELDTAPLDRWPNTTGTRVYKLVQAIINP